MKCPGVMVRTTNNKFYSPPHDAVCSKSITHLALPPPPSFSCLSDGICLPSPPPIAYLPSPTSHLLSDSTVPIRPFISNSLQVAPGIPKDYNRPENGKELDRSTAVWYDGITMGDGGEFNYNFWGAEAGGREYDPGVGNFHMYMEDAMSVNTYLEDTHFEEHHVYRLEWQPGTDGFLSWYIDDTFYMKIDGTSMHNLTGAHIPQEPMYLILNTAISHQWGMAEPCDHDHCSACWLCYDCTNPECQCSLPNGMKNCKNLPAKIEIDYIRLYQDKEDPSHTLGCSPERFPTAEFIEAHSERYKNWEPYTGPIPVRMTVFWFGLMCSTGVATVLLLGVLVGRCYTHFRGDRDGSGSGLVDSRGYVAINTVPVPTMVECTEQTEKVRVAVSRSDEVDQAPTRSKQPCAVALDVPSSRYGLRNKAASSSATQYGSTDDATKKSRTKAAASPLAGWLPSMVSDKVEGLLSRTGLMGDDVVAGQANGRRSAPAGRKAGKAGAATATATATATAGPLGASGVTSMGVESIHTVNI